MARPLSEKVASLPAEEREAIKTRAAEILAEEMSLQALRKARGKTQVKMAAELGIGQDAVSRVEQRSDLLLSTLREYVRKLGGDLELVAHFPDTPSVRIGGFTELAEPAAKARRAATKRGSGGRLGSAGVGSRGVAGKSLSRKVAVARRAQRAN